MYIGYITRDLFKTDLHSKTFHPPKKKNIYRSPKHRGSILRPTVTWPHNSNLYVKKKKKKTIRAYIIRCLTNICKYTVLCILYYWQVKSSTLSTMRCNFLFLLVLIRDSRWSKSLDPLMNVDWCRIVGLLETVTFSPIIDCNMHDVVLWRFSK